MRQPSRAAMVLATLLALFVARVLGQVVAAIAGAPWLPPFDAWYSGLLPYPLLLPAQVLLIAVMGVLVLDQTERRPRLRLRDAARSAALRRLGLLYFLVMALRLALVIRAHGIDQLYLHGAIPVAFHWVLALFLLVWVRAASDCRRSAPQGRWPDARAPRLLPGAAASGLTATPRRRSL